ncbi:MAG: 1-acyl-sn-glycerol-3-phosphate acyltransferase [Lachnospiraceae bacterium]|nr:1-acyl-sn-glycerol-3-phosphate acyltransferase [Lachnospiraceae bacterium]
MRRILLMVFRLFLKTPYYFFQIWRCGKKADITLEESYACVKKVTKAANRAGRVSIEAYGLENIPKENGFIFFPNHQGMFDVLVFLDSCPVPFSFVIKKEASNVILLKQIIAALKAIVIDREDIKQSLMIINQVAEEVKKGRNFLIFAEGTRSKMGNKLLPFKGGTFKSALKSKCPIVPCALIDSFKPFDEKSIARVTVKLIYLKPMYYDEYASMKTNEIAEEVKCRIEEAIADYERKGFVVCP